MKKYLLVLTVLILISGKLHAQQLSLDDTIRRTARAVEEILPQGTMVAVLNFDSPSQAFSDFVIEELTGALVTGRRVTIVDRRNLELIGQEMNLQMSGYVSDESAQSIGHMLGAQSIVSGVLTSMGTFYRFRVRVVNVQTAAIQTQISLDLRNDAQVAFLMGGSQRTQPVVPSVTAPVVSPAEVLAPQIDGIIVPGETLAEKLAWLQRSADSHNTYILEVRANENIAPHTLGFRGAINITIVLRGIGANRTVRLQSNGTLFTVNPNVTLILDNNITLHGHGQNNNPLVVVNGGILRMNTGATITGNTNPGRDERGGGGVRISSGTFEMNGGTIGYNASGNGGGVLVLLGTTFIMTNGTISGNTASGGGGGVLIFSRAGYGVGNFTMRGGIITGNTASNGGGVSMGVDFGVPRASFTMSGGTITGNIATNSGGGVWAPDHPRIIFTKTGGTITGFSNDPTNGNVVRDAAGNILARRGHAVFASAYRRREGTAGTGINLNNRVAGGWDN